MTKFTIPTGDSVHTTADHSTAFQTGSAQADTLIVETGAHLIAEGILAHGAVLDNTGAWTVEVKGVIGSFEAFGIYLAAGNQNMSTINVGKEASVSGFAGIYAESGVTIRNQGSIASSRSTAIEVTGDDRHVLINEGSIHAQFSYVSEFNDSIDIVKNSGNMSGGLFLGNGNDRLTNTNQIDGDSTTNDVYVDLGDGDDRLVNSGKIRIDVLDSAGDDTVSNSGSIEARVRLGSGDDVFTNVSNVDGRKTSGVVIGEIDLGLGDDRMYGGRFAEDYHDAGGSDIVMLAGGNDIYRAGPNGQVDGRDRIDGGKGIDTYDASNSNNVVYINLDSVKHALPFGFGPPNIGAGTAIGADVAGANSDRMKGFENVFAGTSDDIVFGSAKGNYIDGGDGADVLFGNDGNDHLVGSFGDDFLFGGKGLDILTGGTHSDRFMFTSIKDSHPSALRRDRITDFEDGTDLIDLSGIDAVKGGDNDIFHFIGTDVGFTGADGELRAYHVNGGQVVEADTDGDKIADFSVAVADLAQNIVFTSADFQL